jgi:3-oxoacyl-(acyl-carrier-protein) synthase
MNLADVLHRATISVVSPELPGSGDATAAWAAEQLAETGVAADALYVVTSDGGAREALSFWAGAQETGMRFANPGAFPWTLANSATGRISQALAITGPCTTHVGGRAALTDALQDAEDDVAEGLASTVLVVSLHGDRRPTPGGGAVRVELVAYVVSSADT